MTRGADLPGTASGTGLPEADAGLPGPDVVLDPGYLRASAAHFTDAEGELDVKLAAFARFVPRTHLGRFIVRYEIFKEICPVQGSIVECGVFHGAGLFTFAQLSALLEPLNHRRKIIGFDSFAGFPALSEIDRAGGSHVLEEAGLRGATRQELLASVRLYDEDRPLAHLPKIEFVEGDFLETGPRYLEENHHLIVALLYLDFDIFEPTRLALELFLPRMPAGAVVAFDESNVAESPGETQAILESIGLRHLRLRRAPVSSIAWAVLE